MRAISDFLYDAVVNFFDKEDPSNSSGRIDFGDRYDLWLENRIKRFNIEVENLKEEDLAPTFVVDKRDLENKNFIIFNNALKENSNITRLEQRPRDGKVPLIKKIINLVESNPNIIYAKPGSNYAGRKNQDEFYALKKTLEKALENNKKNSSKKESKENKNSKESEGTDAPAPSAGHAAGDEKEKTTDFSNRFATNKGGYRGKGIPR